MTAVEREAVDERELDRVAWNLPRSPHTDESEEEERRPTPEATSDVDDVDDEPIAEDTVGR
jgi:hypothetical protein